MSVAAETAETSRPPLISQKSDAEKRKNSVKRKFGPAITPRYEYTMNKQRSKSITSSSTSSEHHLKDKPSTSAVHDVKPKGFLSSF